MYTFASFLRLSAALAAIVAISGCVDDDDDDAGNSGATADPKAFIGQYTATSTSVTVRRDDKVVHQHSGDISTISIGKLDSSSAAYASSVSFIIEGPLTDGIGCVVVGDVIGAKRLNVSLDGCLVNAGSGDPSELFMRSFGTADLSGDTLSLDYTGPASEGIDSAEKPFEVELHSVLTRAAND